MGETYARPPIVEAIVELRFAGSPRQGDLERAKLKLASVYKKVEDLRQFTMALSADHTAPTQAALIGHKLTSADGTGVVQISNSAFGFSQLPPYPGWTEVEGRAQRAFRKAGALFSGRAITRAAVRYINRLDIPVKVGESILDDDYLNVSVSKLPFPHEGVSATSFNVATTLEGGRFGLIINSGTVPSPLLNQISLLLDIDVYNQDKLPAAGKIWEHIREMRDWKNNIFEACVTDRARGLFK